MIALIAEMEETSEQESVTSESCYESESDDEYDSKEDPTFEEEEETRFNLSNLSIKKKTKDCSGKGTGEGVTVKLDDQELKSYETVLKMIQGGQVEKLKVDQCKIYLRKHGLRLGGIKQTLIHRIKEHVNIVNGGGEEKYPASSFVLNCKGDACTGDVVIFEQNVYEMFSIASRSGNGLCGTRVVAGRIVKESYGAAKQQHTFTIEVLWSKGEKPLPPLHPLLIKGRNLYRLKTMRQKWEDEGERHRILSEKHARGGVARLSREARLQQKQMWKSNKPNRTTRKETSQRQKEEIRETLYPVSSIPEVLINQPKQKQQDSRNGQGEQYCKQKIDGYKRTCELNISKQPEYMHQNPNTIINPHGAPECFYQRQPLISASFPRGPKSDSSGNLTRGFSHDERHMTNNTPKSPNQGHSMGYCSNSNEIKTTFQSHTLKENRGGILGRSPSRGFGYNHIPSQYQMNFISPVYGYHGRDDNFGAARNSPVQGKGYVQNQTCRYYAQGRCYYGDRCKYLHEVAGHKP